MLINSQLQGMANPLLRHRKSTELNIFSLLNSQDWCDCYQNHEDLIAASAAFTWIYSHSRAIARVYMFSIYM